MSNIPKTCDCAEFRAEGKRGVVTLHFEDSQKAIDWMHDHPQEHKSLDDFVAKVEASGYDKLMAALPELPEPQVLEHLEDWCPLFTADMLRDYAIAAMQAYAEVVRAEAKTTSDALCDLSYYHGMRHGWNLCVNDDHAAFAKAAETNREAVRLLKSIRNPDTRTTP